MLTESISTLIWDLKYRYRLGNQVIDNSIEDTWRRVAKAISCAEKDQSKWEKGFLNCLLDFKFLPGGRILAGAGTSHIVTLFNCFVMDIAEDSLNGIFSALKEGALTLQQGGGVGYDFSVLRPHGDLIKKTGLPASGPISFMRIWDTMCSVMLSTGSRRGAMMGVLRCDHPDIEEFITAKRDPTQLRHFNVSVMVSDDFMEAVKKDEMWALIFPTDEMHGEIVKRKWGKSLQPVKCRVYKRIRARELWNSIIKSAYDYAEPGVLFSDTINKYNNLAYCERINATNPCGEIPLPAYGACDLGAINLTQFIIAPFSEKSRINWQDLEETVSVATRFLDNVIDVSHYPLPQQQEQALGTRRIGLGITGLGDAFVMLGIKYGSDKSLKLAADIMQRIADVTWQTSLELAKEKGPFKFFTPAYMKGEFVQRLDARLLAQIEKYGVRNSHHNTIAPTGTISLLANNVSNGIEPIFKEAYIRHVRNEDKVQTFEVRDYAYQLWCTTEKTTALPPAWTDVQALTPEAHLQIQATMQPYIDNAISKTINIPVDFPFEQLAEVYSQAYELKLKGCTVFRPNPITGSVLELPEEKCCHVEEK